VQRVVVDANVFLSFIVHRNDKQRDLAKALFAKAEDGELGVILPQFVGFEMCTSCRAHTASATKRSRP